MTLWNCCAPTTIIDNFLPPTGPISSPVVTPNLYKPLPSPHSLATPSSSHPPTLADLPSPSTGALVGGVPPLNQAGLALESPQEGHLPAPGTHQGNYTPAWGSVPFSKAADFPSWSSRFYQSDSSLFSRGHSCPDA